VAEAGWKEMGKEYLSEPIKKLLQLGSNEEKELNLFAGEKSDNTRGHFSYGR